jgi:flagellar assembly protein FliH
MSRPLALEDFDRRASVSAQPTEGPRETALEEERLAAFEKGYGAGWEDAARAHEEEQNHISAELGRALQEMSFTFHEAQTALAREVEGVLAGLVETVLPAALRPALGEMIRERAQVATQSAGVTVEVVVAPENVARVERIAVERHAPPLRVVGEPALGPGQAFLRFGAAEERIDLDAVLADLRAAVGRFAETGEADTHACPKESDHA